MKKIKNLLIVSLFFMILMVVVGTGFLSSSEEEHAVVCYCLSIAGFVVTFIYYCFLWMETIRKAAEKYLKQ